MSNKDIENDNNKTDAKPKSKASSKGNKKGEGDKKSDIESMLDVEEATPSGGVEKVSAVTSKRGKTYSRQEAIAAFQTIMSNVSGEKSSDTFVEQDEAILDAGLGSGRISPMDLKTLAEGYKKHSASSSSETRRIFNEGMKKREDGTSSADLRKQYASSNLSAKKKKLAQRVLEINDILRVIAQELEFDPDVCLTWGTIIRCKHFEEMYNSIEKDVTTMLVPIHNFATQSLAFYNRTPFEVLEKFMSISWLNINHLLSELKSKGFLVEVKPGGIIPGSRNLISTKGQWSINEGGIKAMRQAKKEADDKDLIIVGETLLVKPTTDSNLYVVLKASKAVDCRGLLQTPEMRQMRKRNPNGRDFIKMKKSVKTQMNVVRMLDGMEKTETPVDLNSHTPFTDEYYHALVRIRATVRAMHYQIEPRQTGPNGREGTLIV